MGKAARALLVALIAAPLAAPARADEYRLVPGHCLAIVDGKTTIHGACVIELDVGGAFALSQDGFSPSLRVTPDKDAGTAKAVSMGEIGDWGPD